MIVLGGYFASLWVGWYFAICLQWNAHGNEAGGAGRVTDCGEFLRIKLTEDRAEVWAIAVEEKFVRRNRVKRIIRSVDPMPTARVVDHFTISLGRPAGG